MIKRLYLLTKVRIYYIIYLSITEVKKMNYTWDLDRIYTSFECDEFKNDISRMEETVKKLDLLTKEVSQPPRDSECAEIIATMEMLNSVVGRIFLYTSLNLSDNSNDPANMNAHSMVARKYASVNPIMKKAQKLLAAADYSDKASKYAKLFEEYSFMLDNLKKKSRHYLSDDAEDMFSLMDVTSGSAWSTMASSLTSSLAVDYNGEKITLSQVRNLAYSPDKNVRKAAYEAELAAYPKIEQPMAFAINNIKIQATQMAKKRGYSSALDATLDGQNMTKETLDAMLGEMKKYLPHFHRYLKAKAKYLGYEGSLPWYDLFAPVGSFDAEFTPESAGEYLTDAFKSFSDDMYNMMKSAFENRWIDFYPRDGKSGGAFCSCADCLGESRILTNFDGSFSAVGTLAHELGHAFHNLVLRESEPLNRRGFPMPLAETASTFNETYLLNHALKNATDEERLYLLQSYLSDTTQIMCDIYSRYTFESKVFELCQSGFVSADKLCRTMLDAQKEAYGDGLDNDILHPYMWVCKSHYYSAGRSFYNFPYAFGGLLSTGLYAVYEQDKAAFEEKYKSFLRATTVMTIEDAVSLVGYDVTRPDFWRQGLETYKKLIDEFCELCDKQ